MLADYHGEIVNAKFDKENQKKVILSKLAYVPGFKKKFDPREKKFVYQKTVGIGECAVMSSLFAVSWQGTQCYVDETHFPILTISTTDRHFAENYSFKMPMWGYWLKDVDIKECIDFSHTVIRRKGKEKEEKTDYLTEDEFIKEWKKYHNNLCHDPCYSESLFAHLL